MKLLNIFNVASGTIGFVAGSTAALVVGLPILAVPVAGASAAAAAFIASTVSSKIIGAMCDGKGPGAGFAGIGAEIVAHLTAVPAATVFAAHQALTYSGFLPPS